MCAARVTTGYDGAYLHGASMSARPRPTSVGARWPTAQRIGSSSRGWRGDDISSAEPALSLHPSCRRLNPARARRTFGLFEVTRTSSLAGLFCELPLHPSSSLKRYSDICHELLLLQPCHAMPLLQPCHAISVAGNARQYHRNEIFVMILT